MKILTLACCFIAFTQAFSAEILPWTSKTGHSFQGSFVSKDANSITLKGTDGKTVKVPVNVLDEKSLLQLEKVYEEALKNAPIFTYQSTFYRYAIYARQDWLHLEFLQAGQPRTPEPFILRVSLGEKVGRDWKNYRITGLDGEPIESRDEVEVRFTTDKGVILRLFAAKEVSKEFSFHFSLDDSYDEGKRLLYRNTLRFEPLLEYDVDSKLYKGPFSESGYTFQELPGVFEDYSIEYRRNGDSKKIPYSEKQKGSHSGSKFVITHPNYPELTIDKGDNPGLLNMWFYGGKAPLEGYGLRFESGEGETQEAGPFTLELE